MKGASIIEILIAVFILTLGVSAVILLAFANQSVKNDSITAIEAAGIAKKMIESARAKSRENFDGVISIPAALENIYLKSLSVSDFTPCLKEAISLVSYSPEQARPQEVRIGEIFSDIAGVIALGGDCGDSGPTGNWDNPTTFGDVDLSPAGIKGTGVDVFKYTGNRYAVLSSVHAAAGSPDLWLIDANLCTTAVGSNCVIADSVNLGPSGLNAVDVAREPSTGKYYAYAAADDNGGQFKVVEIDFSIPGNPQLVLKAERDLAGVDPAGSYPEGVSIFYYGGYVYVGTKETAGPEFHIFDVSPDPENPVEVGQLELTHNINAIASDGDYAYLASSSDTEEVIVVDVGVPSTPAQVGAFDAKNTGGGASSEDGWSIYLTGSKLYLGRERVNNANERDFYILDKTSLAVMGSKRICWYSSSGDPTPDCLSNNTEITGIVISGPFAYLAASDSNAGFQVWNISDPANIFQQSKCSAYNYSEKARAIDFMDNFGFIANESNDALRVIYDLPSTCS